MESLEVTRLSSKGQVVLPQVVRRRLGLNEGAKFLVIGSGDTIILKRLEMPTRREVKTLLAASRAYARRAGLTPHDVRSALSRVRLGK